MLPPSLTEVIHNSPAVLLPERYAVAKVNDVPEGVPFFIVTRDSDEITVIATEEQLERLCCVSVEKWFRLVEFKVSVPFEAPGFLAAIAHIAADVGINVYIVSTYSKDYVLIREHEIDAAVAAFKSIGFWVKE